MSFAERVREGQALAVSCQGGAMIEVRQKKGGGFKKKEKRETKREASMGCSRKNREEATAEKP